MKVLMLGWEFPPFFAGGLGMVCYELTKALANEGTQITYIMPFGPKNTQSPYARLLVAENTMPNVKIYTVSSGFGAYLTPEEYEKRMNKLEETGVDTSNKNLYGDTLYEEVELFSKRVLKIAEYLDFDVIHAHDWMTYPAAINLSKKTGKPVVLHIHNTVYDRYLNADAKHEHHIEQWGFSNCDKIIAISNYVKNMLLRHYDVDPHKISIIHNANMPMDALPKDDFSKIKQQDKVVLFAGRITIQKGPEYFVEAARLVLQKMNNVKFIVAGGGDMLTRMINMVAHYGISDKFIFTGKPYTREEAMKFFSMADVFVMPSPSEPFGLVPLEAMMTYTPTIISKQSGISEVVQNALKVDFWDTRKMANQIVSLLNFQVLHHQIKNYGYEEAKNLTWDKPARQCLQLYSEVIRQRR